MAWHSVLTLAFDAQHAGEHARTNLVQRHHQGALRVQKALYPESGEQQGICHVIMLYPPAGIALGDKLDIDIGVKHHAHAVITTPGANKWYGNLPSYTANKQTDDSPSARKTQETKKTKKLKRIQIVMLFKMSRFIYKMTAVLNGYRKKTVFITQVLPMPPISFLSAQLPVLSLGKLTC